MCCGSLTENVSGAHRSQLGGQWRILIPVNVSGFDEFIDCFYHFIFSFWKTVLQLPSASHDAAAPGQSLTWLHEEKRRKSSSKHFQISASEGSTERRTEGQRFPADSCCTLGFILDSQPTVGCFFLSQTSLLSSIFLIFWYFWKQCDDFFFFVQ